MSERGSIGSTYTVVILIGLVCISIFVTPLIMTANKVDNASQSSLQTATTEFVNEQCNKGKLTLDDLNKFTEKISGTNSYDVEIQVKKIGENPSKKTMLTTSKKIGENVSTIYYTSQVMDQLDENKEISFQEGDELRVYIQNTNTTTAQQLSSSANSDTSKIVADATAICKAKGE